MNDRQRFAVSSPSQKVFISLQLLDLWSHYSIFHRELPALQLLAVRSV